MDLCDYDMCWSLYNRDFVANIKGNLEAKHLNNKNNSLSSSLSTKKSDDHQVNGMITDEVKNSLFQVSIDMTSSYL